MKIHKYLVGAAASAFLGLPRRFRPMDDQLICAARLLEEFRCVVPPSA